MKLPPDKKCWQHLSKEITTRMLPSLMGNPKKGIIMKYKMRAIANQLVVVFRVVLALQYIHV